MNKKTINVVFRLDDFSAVSLTEIELQIIALFREHHSALTFGIIPFVCSLDIADPSEQRLTALPPEKIDVLRAGVESGTIDVALHGYSHQTVTAGTKTEFAGLTFADQLEKLSRGRTALESASVSPVRIFIPPWNSYDLNTIRALDQLNISILSAGWSGVAAPDTNLRFLPATTDIMHLRDAIAAARRAPDKQPIVVVLFHLYDFAEVSSDRGRITLQEFTGILDWIGHQQDIQVLSITQAMDSIENLRVDRFLALEAWRGVQRVTPSVLREQTPVLVYHEASICGKAVRKVLGFYTLLAIFFIVWAASTCFLYSANSDTGRLIAGLFFLISGIAIAYAIVAFRVSPGSVISAAKVVRDSLVFCHGNRVFENHDLQKFALK